MTGFAPIVAIVGPTAVGKTSLAIQLAQSHSGEIVSCDSVQVFKGLDIGSAKPDANERAMVPHHLIDIYSPDFQADVGLYKTSAEKAILDIQTRKQLPILTGGTGMYFNSLFYGLIDAPPRDDSLRSSLEAKAASEGTESLYQELCRVDSEAASKIMPADLRRIIRALEVNILSGSSLSTLQKDNKKLELNWLVIGVTMDRKALYERIEKRIDGMIKAGLINETRLIIDQYGSQAYSLGSIGYRHAKNYIEGTWDLDTMLFHLKQDTRRYAKRQLTWFRKVQGIRWFDNQDIDNIKLAVTTFLEQKGGVS